MEDLPSNYVTLLQLKERYLKEKDLMEAVPSNYVTLLQLKERYLKEKEQKEKEEREQRKREEEEEEERAEKELRLQQLKEERNPAGVVVVKSRGMISRPMVDWRKVGAVADRSVSECEGGEGEGKSEGVEEEKRLKKKRKKKVWNKKKNVRAEKEEVSSEKEGEAVEVSEESSNKASNGGGRRRGGCEFRGKKSKNVEKIEQEFEGLKISGDAEIGDDRLRRPNSRNVGGAKDEIESKGRERRNDRRRRTYRRNVGDKEEIEPKGREFGVNGETERGNDRRRRPNHWNGGAREEIEPKVRDLEMNCETEGGSDRLKGQKSEESEPKVKDFSENGETERGDRLRMPNSKEESEPKLRELAMTGEIEGGKGRLWRPKGNNVDGKDETGKKGTDSSVKADSERGDQMLRRPSRFHYHGNVKVWGYKNEKQRQWAGLAWVKKGEVSDGNVAGVHSLEHSISRSTRASLNA